MSQLSNVFMYTQVAATMQPRYAHTMTAFSLSPELTEVIMFGGKANKVLLSDTLLLRFGKLNIPLYFGW